MSETISCNPNAKQVALVNETSTSQSGFATLLGKIRETSVVICVECSANSIVYLKDVIKHVIEALSQLANKKESSTRYFNIIAFNSEVTQWSDEPVRLTPETVAVCSDWLNALQPASTSDTLGALLAALRHPKVDAVYLLAVGPPDQDRDEILDHLAHVSLDRPVHCRLVIGQVEQSNQWQGQDQRRQARDALETIARETQASFAIVEPSQAMGQVNAEVPGAGVIRTGNGRVYPANVSNAAVGLTLKNDPLYNTSTNNKTPNVFPCYHPYSNWPHVPYPPFTTWSRYALRPEVEYNLNNPETSGQTNPTKYRGSSQSASALLLNRKVLARSKVDGLYYPGIVKEQDKADTFLISFDASDDTSDKFNSTDYQQTRILDLVDLEDAWHHCILPGDRVLAPDTHAIGKHGLAERYVPGTVLEGSESRLGYGKDKGTAITNTNNLTVALTAPSNRTVTLRKGRAIWIPEPLFRRLCLEGCMPAHARDTLSDVRSYPEKSLPGYPTSAYNRNPKEYEVVQPKLLKGRELQVDHLLPPFCLPVYPVMERLVESSVVPQVQWGCDWNVVESYFAAKRAEENAMIAESSIIPGTSMTVKKLREEMADALKPIERSRQSHIKSPSSKTQLNVPQSPSPSVHQFMHTNDPEERPHSAPCSPLPASVFVTSPYTDDLPDARPIRRPSSSSKSSSSIRPHEVSQSLVPRRPMSYDRPAVLKELSASRRLHHQQAQEAQCRRKIAGPWRERSDGGVEMSSQLARQDIEKEEKARNKLDHKRSMVKQRLVQEEYRFVDQEVAKDRFVDAQRARTLNRIQRENMRLKAEQEQLDLAQENKRQLLSQIRSEVVQAAAETEFKSGEWAADKRVALLRQQQQAREAERAEKERLITRAVQRQEELQFNRSACRWNEVHERLLQEEAKMAAIKERDAKLARNHGVRLRNLLGPDSSISAQLTSTSSPPRSHSQDRRRQPVPVA